MRHSRAVGRYSRALFDVSLKEADPRAVEQQLAAFVDLLNGHPQLKKVLLNPVVPPERRKAAVAEIASRMALSPVLAKLLTMVAERDGLAFLPDLLERYRQRLMEHLGEVRAEVTTAIALPDDRIEAIRRGLAEVTGKAVTMVARVDPEIIGGVVARVGSTVYDGSITRQLEKIRDRLVGGA
jgi:F-type H+-transporting ATPase subunit delta